MSTEPTDAARNLLRLLDAAREGRPLDEETAAWLLKGGDVYLSGEQPLDKSLGLVGKTGFRSARYVILKARRDEALRLAWQALPDALSPWQRSTRLLVELQRFETRVWPRLKYERSPPGRLSEVERYLFAAFKTGIRAPAKTNRVHELMVQTV